MRKFPNTPVAVRWWYNATPERYQRYVYPVAIYWRGEWHDILFWGLYHYYGQRDSLRHIFEVASPKYWFRLSLNPLTLVWRLEIVSDE